MKNTVKSQHLKLFSLLESDHIANHKPEINPAGYSGTMILSRRRGGGPVPGDQMSPARRNFGDPGPRAAAGAAAGAVGAVGTVTISPNSRSGGDGGDLSQF